MVWLLLLTVLPSGCLFVHGQRYQHFTIPTPIAADEFLVVGFLGGRDSWDNTEVGVGRLAARLRDSGIDRVHFEIVENKKRDLAVTLVRNSFDRNSDGHIDGLERASIGLIVYGQSFGGAAVVKFARQMEELDVPILLTIQVDSIGIGDGVIPPNVRSAANLFQRDGWIIRGEPEIRAEDPARTRILGNFRFSYKSRQIDLTDVAWFKKIGRVAHTKMDRDPEVWDQVEQLIRDAVESARVLISRSAVEPVLGMEGARCSEVAPQKRRWGARRDEQALTRKLPTKGDWASIPCQSLGMDKSSAPSATFLSRSECLARRARGILPTSPISVLASSGP